MTNMTILSFILVIVLNCPSRCSVLPQIIVLPGTEIEVGEEVQFKIPLNISFNDTDASLYEWDFGDGYYMKKGFPSSSHSNSGPTCIHFFMKPGKFTVKVFKITSTGKDSSTTVVNVNGQSPIPGFELWHAPFHSRISQYIYAKIPLNIALNKSNKLKITINGSNGYSKILINKPSLKSEEKFLFKNSELPKDSYTLRADLYNAEGKIISYLKEKFDKPYDGIPAVGINENNALCINGRPTFLVTGFLLSDYEYTGWAKNCVNAGIGVGYYENHSLNTWKDYLSTCESYDRFVIGPIHRWVGGGGFCNERNSNIESIEQYVHTTKDEPSLLMWSWKDEPDLGGRDIMIPPPVLASWTSSCHKIDPHHPVWVNLTGGNYMTYWNEMGGNGTVYDYIGSDSLYGGKKHFPVDFIGFDIYPLESCTWARLKNRRVMEEFALSYDRLIERNYNLIPISGFVECQEIENLETPLPTPDQILMEAWITVIHGAKMVSWFHYFGMRPQTNIEAMNQFCSQMKTYGNIILSAPSNRIITDDANVPGKRVDFISRDTIVNHYGQSDTCTYVFAVRVTEPEGSDIYVQVKEPETIKVTYHVSGISEMKIYDVNSNRWITPDKNSFSDTLGKCSNRIYIISKNGFNADKDITFKAIESKNHRIENTAVINLQPFKNTIVVPADIIQNMKVYNLKGNVVGRMMKNSSSVFWNGKLSTGMYLISDNKNFNLKLSLINQK